MEELNGQERTQLFSTYAHTDLDRWKHLIGHRVVHRLDGPGIITDLNEKYVCFAPEAQPALEGWIILGGEMEVSQYVFGMFRDLLIDIDLPTEAEGLEHLRQQFIEELPERRRKEAAEVERARDEERRANEERQRQEAEWKRQEEEAAARAEFRELKRVFAAEHFKDESPLSPLFLILKAISEGDRLSRQDETWLEELEIFRALATYYEHVAYLGEDFGYVARASRFWRKAGEPVSALRITEYAIESPDWQFCSPETRAPVLTTRGGALRDIGNFDEAENCALDAIQLTPRNYHPFNLLGGIYYSRGLPEEGDRYFREAENRGAPGYLADNMIRSALKTSEPEAQRRVAIYLLRKDVLNNTNRYAWAQRYLQ